MSTTHEPTAKPPGANVLVVGRSPSALVPAVDILRKTGYTANATNQFDRVLTDYDAGGVDILVFGGMVPPDIKQHVRDELTRLNPEARVIQGLFGIPELIAAQVAAATCPPLPEGDEVAYDADHRCVRLTIHESADVRVEVWWATSFTPPEPTSVSERVYEKTLDPGAHVIPIPHHVPEEASFGAVTVGQSVQVFTIGPVPDSVRRLVPTSAEDKRLPDVTAVTTRVDES
ncbi:hypothetical protein [Microbispora rosea]|uniref:hypothetical protein n=1 Tax=Microbispora rosea TaxID=58117 RepID=UPI003D90626F